MVAKLLAEDVRVSDVEADAKKSTLSDPEQVPCSQLRHHDAGKVHSIVDEVTPGYST